MKEEKSSKEESINGNGETPKAELSVEEKEKLILEDMKEHVKCIEKAVSAKEPRFMLRAMRAIPGTRKKLKHSILRKLICGYMPIASSNRDSLLAYLDEPMDTEESGLAFRPRSAKAASLPLLPELDTYFHLLIVIHLLDTKCYNKALECSNDLMQKTQGMNRRSMDALLAKCYFFHSRAYEVTDRLKDIRSFLHSKLRTATLRHDDEGQASLLNLLLRNYLHYNLYDQADKLVSKSSFPTTASTNAWARYLYYTGIIKAIQLDYTEAHKNLLQAIRKAPQNFAYGFKQTAHKFAIVVELLLGEIPDRAIFRQPFLRKTLMPYFQLTKAVLNGDLKVFNQVVEKFKERFLEEKTYTIIIRLRHNVIKAGVRMINLSYSKISFVDIAQKLQLDSPEDAEFIVAKAIRDGVIEASIDHEKGTVQSKENVDIYSTNEPQGAFHQRISFCLDIYNQSVKAMRFPPKSYSKNLESFEEQREREKQDMELAKEMAEEDDDFP
ncbi:predicted protein [Nematostella vectensis]|uniref:26S proteasome regulatory subunit RPN3 n=2 Tax=Nematostella vectensis TaxID=45351 RepID=A7SQQ7_NEMVE|nr:predicted protein [Nematostella vectensis]|eukprot:XP_001626069.1 predicted protein [Nematostella vectensis]